MVWKHSYFLPVFLSDRYNVLQVFYSYWDYVSMLYHTKAQKISVIFFYNQEMSTSNSSDVNGLLAPEGRVLSS